MHAGYSLDNRDIRRALTVPPFLEASLYQARTFYGDAPTVALASVGPMVADRDFRLECRFICRGHDHGVIFSLGDPIAGMALFARDGYLNFVYHGGTGTHVLRDGLALAQGENCFVLEHSALGERRGSAKILLNGKEVFDPVNTSPTLILGWVGEGLDLGMDRKQHVTPLYGEIGPFPFTGKVILVRIEPGAQASDSYANRPEISSQRS